MNATSPINRLEKSTFRNMTSAKAYLLDTDTCIYTIKQKPCSVVEKVKKTKESKIFISSITVSELEYGLQKSKMRNKTREALIRFLVPFNIVDFTSSDAYQYGIIRSYLESIGQIIGPYDQQIAAQAISRKLILVTNNIKEFSRIPDLKLENWVKD